MKKLQTYLAFCQKMGGRYVFYRSLNLLRNCIQFLVDTIPTTAPRQAQKDVYSLNGTGMFFFQSREELLTRKQTFKPGPLDPPVLPASHDWLRHPSNGYLYSLTHWTRINDFSSRAGDIKEVWERSRFTFLYDLVRYDFHEGNDCSENSIRTIEDWIKSNPPNKGPNWKCGQEISIRVFAWIFALFYYRNSPSLSPGRLQSILHSIRLQARRVEANINYSRFVVRNNHALTETLFLYIIGTLFPCFSESDRWKRNGMKWFEEAISYQLNDEGAFLQHSTNYQRVVVQLLTWAIRIGELNNDQWDIVVLRRAQACLNFLYNLQDRETGWLPNYGPNDGALFFPLSSAHIRDYRPQLGALHSVLTHSPLYASGNWEEESFWLAGPHEITRSAHVRLDKPKCISYPHSGYFLFRNQNNLIFVRCGLYSDRPTQADNLHLDLWRNGENLLFDAGTFRYNTVEKAKAYYAGTEAHNTVAIESYDQMCRGPRFIWTHWIETAEAECFFDGTHFHFEGKFKGFTHLVRGGITHKRQIVADPLFDHIVVTDTIMNKPLSYSMRQLWHPSPLFLELYEMNSQAEDGEVLHPKTNTGWYSETYGQKAQTNYLEFSTHQNSVTTVFAAKHKKMPPNFEYTKHL